MRMSDFVVKEAIVPDLKAATKEGAAVVAGTRGEMDARGIYQALGWQAGKVDDVPPARDSASPCLLA